MTSSKILALGLGLSLALAAPALADGMPFKNKTPTPSATALDKAIDEIQNKQPDGAAVPPVDTTPAPEPVAAPEPPPVPESRVVEVQQGSSFFGLSVGMYDAFTHGKQAIALNMQYEPGVKIAGVLQPLFGALVATNGALMGYGGVGIPFKLSPHVRFMPSVAVGAYHKGGGVDLGQVLAWRGGAELAYIFDDQSRLGLTAHVLTNGSFNRADRTEVIGLTYTMPFELFSGKNRKEAATAQDAPTPPTK